jgi:hypothetical protein
MPIQFECEEQCLTRLTIDTNVSLLDLTIIDENKGESLFVMIDYENAEILINEIRKRVNQIKKNLKK